MRISFIAAIGENRELGNGGKLPWHLPDDLKRFKELTRGHTVIMGRKTYESIGRILPERNNIIFTRNREYRVSGAVVVTTIPEALKASPREGEVFVIGGGEIFALFFPLVSRLYLTHVDAKLSADSFFPEFDTSEWETLSEEFHLTDEKHIHEFTFKTYQRKQKVEN